MFIVFFLNKLKIVFEKTTHTHTSINMVDELLLSAPDITTRKKNYKIKQLSSRILLSNKFYKQPIMTQYFYVK